MDNKYLEKIALFGWSHRERAPLRKQYKTEELHDNLKWEADKLYDSYAGLHEIEVFENPKKNLGSFVKKVSNSGIKKEFLPIYKDHMDKIHGLNGTTPPVDYTHESDKYIDDHINGQFKVLLSGLHS